MKKAPVTACIRLLRERSIAFTPHEYAYKEHGGAPHAARELGVDPHAVIKTLVFEDQGKQPLLMLMHGDKTVSAKNLARALGVKSVSPATPKDVERYTGYKVGGVSPFGTRRQLPVFIQSDILQLPKIYINGGKRGLLIELVPPDIDKVLDVTPVAAIAEEAVA